MKTKLLFTIFFLTGLSYSLFSQDYHPLLNNSTWRVAVYDWGGENFFNLIEDEEVTFGTHTYKKYIMDNEGTQVYYLREDVSQRKVYHWINNTDKLLFDFSIDENGSYTFEEKDYTATVSTTVVNGGTRKKIYLYHPLYISETWIEGVGNSTIPLRNSYGLPSDPHYSLYCSAQNGVEVYNDGLANGGEAVDCSSILHIENFLSYNLNFYPNPFENTMTISSNIEFDNSSVLIYNTIGQVVKTVSGVNGFVFTLDRKNLTNGVYLIKIFQGSSILTTQKIIVK